MSFQLGLGLTTETFIVSLFMISISFGLLGLYLGWICRKKLKDDTYDISIKFIDIIVILIFIYYEIKDIWYWFIEDHFDNTTLEISWILVGVLFSLGNAFLMYVYMLLGVKISERIKKWRNKDDADGEVQTQ